MALAVSCLFEPFGKCGAEKLPDLLKNPKGYMTLLRGFPQMIQGISLTKEINNNSCAICTILV